MELHRELNIIKYNVDFENLHKSIMMSLHTLVVVWAIFNDLDVTHVASFLVLSLLELIPKILLLDHLGEEGCCLGKQNNLSID